MFHTKHADLIDPGNMLYVGVTEILPLYFGARWRREKSVTCGMILELITTTVKYKVLPGIYAFTGNEYIHFLKKEKFDNLTDAEK